MQRGGNHAPNDGLGAADAGFDPFTAAQNEYGTLPGGENPVRPDDAPRSTNGEGRVSQTVVTTKGAQVTPDEFVPLIEKRDDEGRVFVYSRQQQRRDAAGDRAYL
jgi:hypothetical protein